MPRYDFTIFANLRARSLESGDLNDIKRLFDKEKLTYNLVDIKNSKKLKPAEMAGTLLAVGGDGTVNAVAGLAIKHKRILGLIPAGTFNHFAKDLGLPLETPEAVKTIKMAKTSKLDYGEVNNQIFLNNAVIGFYPNVIAGKKDFQAFGKWIGLAVSAIKVLLKLKSYRLQLFLDNKQEIKINTMLVVVSNNKYDLENIGLATRKRLYEGKIYVYVIKHKTLPKMIIASLRLLVGKVKPKDFNLYHAEKLKITSKKTILRVAIDGEHIKLPTPLNIQIVKKSLEVIN